MKKRIIALSLMLLAAALAFSGCGKADISAYGDTPIEISGITAEDFTVTPAELLELECVTRSATGRSEKAGTVNAYGPLLDTFLAQYGYSMTDFDKIRFICADEYKIVLKDEYLTDGYEVVMAASHGSKALDETEQPLRILIPEAESSMWAYSVVRIEFVLGE